MADKAIVSHSVLNAIGQAIIAKGGASGPMLPQEMPSCIRAIEGGGDPEANDPPVMLDWDAERATETVYVLNIKEDNTTVIPFTGVQLADGSSSYTIDWGDGSPVDTSSNVITTTHVMATTAVGIFHTYEHKGRYVVRLSDDVRTLFLTSNYSGYFNDAATNAAFNNLCVVLDKVCMFGSKIVKLGQGVTSGFTLSLSHVRTIGAWNPEAELGGAGMAFSRTYVYSTTVNTTKGISAGALQNIIGEIHRLIVPNVTGSIAVGAPQLRILPSVVSIGDGGTLSFQTYIPKKESLAVVDQEGNVISGMAYGAVAGAYTIRFSASGVKNLFDNTVPLGNGLTERACVEKALMDKGITLVW